MAGALLSRGLTLDPPCPSSSCHIKNCRQMTDSFSSEKIAIIDLDTERMEMVTQPWNSHSCDQIGTLHTCMLQSIVHRIEATALTNSTHIVINPGAVLLEAPAVIEITDGRRCPVFDTTPACVVTGLVPSPHGSRLDACSLDISLTSPETVVVVHGTRVPSCTISSGAALLVCPSIAMADPPRNSLVPYHRTPGTGRAGHLAEGHDPAVEGQYGLDIDQSRRQGSGRSERCSSGYSAAWHGAINQCCAPCHQ